MNLNTERKVKFWLSSIAKILVIALVAFKLIPFVLGTNEPHGENTGEEKKEATRVMQDSALPARSTTIKQSRIPKEDTVVKTYDSDGISEENTTNSSLTGDVEGVKNSIGIFIFDENNLDRAMARQLEKTILQAYQIKLISPIPDKQQLLNGTMKGLNNLEHVCVGGVSYTFKENTGKITCELRLNFDTYATQTGLKIKDRSGSITRYGIGFSREQAKEVAIGKVNSL